MTILPSKQARHRSGFFLPQLYVIIFQMNILAIESSCDETACAILHDTTLLSNVVVSQIDIFKAYGGVIPEVAARNHLEAILPVIDKAMTDAKTTWDDIDAVAVTHTPGLLGSLLIGTLTARTLAILHDKPLYAVHHLKSHIYSNWLTEASESSFEATKENSRISGGDHERSQSMAGATRMALRSARLGDDGNQTEFIKARKKLSDTPEFPLLALVISGGHTQIIYMKQHNSFEIIGTTLDDAVGECFDKVAKILGLPYPGGPSVAKAAEKGNPDKYKFPHPKIDNLDFSFSGLKTAVLRAVQKECGVGLDYPSHELKNLLTPEQIADFAASFQKTAVDILLEKLSTAKNEHPDIKSIVFAGGVSANQALRKAATTQASGEIASSPAASAGYDRGRASATPATAGWRDLRPTERAIDRKRAKIYFPLPRFSGDNAAMVAMASYYEIQSGVEPTDPYSLDISPRSIIS